MPDRLRYSPCPAAKPHDADPSPSADVDRGRREATDGPAAEAISPDADAATPAGRTPKGRTPKGRTPKGRTISADERKRRDRVDRWLSRDIPFIKTGGTVKP